MTTAFPSWFPPVGELTGRQLLRKGELNGARDALEPELARFLRQGALPDRYRLSRDLADVERHAGRWELSERYVEQAEEYADAGVRRDSWSEAELAQRSAALAVLCGPVEEARDLAARGIACAEAIHWPHLVAMNRWGVGALELSLDDPARAWKALEDLPGTETWGRLEVVEAVADAIEALVGLGRLDAADELLRTLWEGPRPRPRLGRPRLAPVRGVAAARAGEPGRSFRRSGGSSRGFRAKKLSTPFRLARYSLPARRCGARESGGARVRNSTGPARSFSTSGRGRWVERCRDRAAKGPTTSAARPRADSCREPRRRARRRGRRTARSQRSSSRPFRLSKHT